MKLLIFVFSFMILFSSCDGGNKTTVADNSQSVNDEDTGDTGNIGDSGNSGNTGNTGDTRDSGNTALDIDVDEIILDENTGDSDNKESDDDIIFPCSENQCYIDGKCFNHLEINSERICQWCNIHRNKYDWSLKPEGEVCRTSAGICDVEETCTGLSAYCPEDIFKDNSIVCREIAGDSDCDVEERCSGLSAECPEDGFQPSTVVCRELAGVCDVEEKCTGASAFCPTDLKLTTVCRESAGVCDTAESCDGENNNCPSDSFKSSSVVCREAGGICDVAENCTGNSATCPDDSVAQNTLVCRESAGDCDISENCDGTSKTCPEDALKPSTETCRASGGICDIEENCTGISAECPTDAKLTSVCRESAGVCDVAESCDGVNDDCPADSFAGTDVACTDDGNLCNGDEYCDGSGNCSQHVNPITCGICEYCIENTGECHEYFFDICTDQESCYNNSTKITCPSVNEDFYGQDSQYAELGYCRAKNFTISGTSPEEIIIDNNTGLQWQRTISTDTYTWLNAEVSYCGRLNYGGYDDWRLPTTEELGTIVDYEKYNPAIDENYFSDTPSGKFWSSSTGSYGMGLGTWYTDFKYGNATYFNSISYLELNVRCVRGTEWKNPDTFKQNSNINGDILVRDLSTNFIWTKNYAENMNWQEALDYCENLDYWNHTDWRLPNINELTTIIDIGEIDPASNFPDISSVVFWTSTSYASDKSSAWVASFYNGKSYSKSKSEEASVLCIANSTITECESEEESIVPCGYNNNGTQPAICVDGFWEATVECDDPDECVNNDRKVVDCAEDETKSQNQVCINGEWINNGACFLSEGMIFVPAGSFWMGSPDTELGRSSKETLHYVEITRGFYMDSTEVTQKSFNDLMGYNPSNFSSCGDDCPVERVSWHEALAYANERSKADLLEECFDCTGSAPDFECSLKSEFEKPQDCLGYRLPTESEWEYAARAGTITAFYNGDITSSTGNDTNLNEIGWYDQNSENTTQPVGGKLANSFGLFDMSGNVWEWNWDWYDTYPTGTEAHPDVDPTGSESGSYRVKRGGSWYSIAYSCRSANRYYVTPADRYGSLGFRLTRTK